jgi:hypothetical protein
MSNRSPRSGLTLASGSQRSASGIDRDTARNLDVRQHAVAGLRGAADVGDREALAEDAEIREPAAVGKRLALDRPSVRIGRQTDDHGDGLENVRHASHRDRTRQPPCHGLGVRQSGRPTMVATPSAVTP